MMEKRHVSVGQKYNYLTVVSRAENHITPNGAIFSQWLCRCDCGNSVIVRGTALTTGHTKSCGCLNKRYRTNDESMVGKKFGRLTVVSRAPSHKTPSGPVLDMWNCVCDCGSKTVSIGRNLRKGKTTSCGCYRIERQAAAKFTPKAESWAKQYFDEHGIKYDYQKSFPGLFGFNGGLLSYDFYLVDMNVLLELNGLQHYEPVDWFGGEQTLMKQQHNDACKEEYARCHGYRYVVIDTNRMSKSKLYQVLDDALFGTSTSINRT